MADPDSATKSKNRRIDFDVDSDSESNVVVSVKKPTAAATLVASATANNSNSNNSSSKQSSSTFASTTNKSTATASTSSFSATVTDSSATVPVPPRVCQFNYTNYTEEKDETGPVRRNATCLSCHAVIKRVGAQPPISYATLDTSTQLSKYNLLTIVLQIDAANVLRAWDPWPFLVRTLWYRLILYYRPKVNIPLALVKVVSRQ